MTDQQKTEIIQAIIIGFDQLSLSITTGILMGGWTPTDCDIARGRAANAVRTARNIVNDARSTAIAERLK